MSQLKEFSLRGDSLVEQRTVSNIYNQKAPPFQYWKELQLLHSMYSSRRRVVDRLVQTVLNPGGEKLPASFAHRSGVFCMLALFLFLV